MSAKTSSLPCPLDFASLSAAYSAGRLRPSQVIAAIFDDIAARGKDGVWISLSDRDAAMAQAAVLETKGPSAEQPLWGIPFAAKDNIDAAGLPTTAACPDFAYMPPQSATTVARLIAAGAILIGKTNLDQFATGLVGTRTPYGVAQNPFNADYIPGGSSSGSAVAVSSGLVSFALGTDTAGSGRVPAGFNNIVGLKPSIGLLSAHGVVPACRSLDCISVFALTVHDTMAVLRAASGFDAADDYSRAAPPGWTASVPAAPTQFRFGLPRGADLKFFGNAEAEKLFSQAVTRLQAMGGDPVEIDYTPFAEAASLLYRPAGAAERTAAVADFMTTHAEAMHPVTRRIIESGRDASGVDVHRMHYRLQALRQQTASVWRDIDVLLVPTSGTIYRVAEIEAEPIQLNANLGYYTNFVNYFDLTALAVPNGFQSDGLPAGITLIAPRFHEPVLAAIGAAAQRAANLPLGATGHAFPDTAIAPTTPPYPFVPLAVFGAHLSGQPLNHELQTIDARLVGPAQTSADYKLYALPGAVQRPGLVRTASGQGAKIECEVWLLPTAGFGSFVARIPGPLGIGDVTLDDGRVIKGFVCEAAGISDANDITGYGGWRAYRQAAD
ncbi:MAG: allophanate hydrolase [Ferrovibrio sp.]|uniref:allophanate hydrolase n=1 Tax=Ferrovibrio sp. TaxID=1917215 RepID=UPI0039197E3C